MTMYCALLMAPGGDWVTDFPNDTIANVWDCLDNMGSKWFFYPYVVVIGSESERNSNLITHDAIIVDGGEGFPFFDGKCVREIVEYLRKVSS